MQIEWLSWCRNRSGAGKGGKSGQQYTRTKLRHAVVKGEEYSLCARSVQLFPKKGEVIDGIKLPECKVCRKLVTAVESAAKEAYKNHFTKGTA